MIGAMGVGRTAVNIAPRLSGDGTDGAKAICGALASRCDWLARMAASALGAPPRIASVLPNDA